MAEEVKKAESVLDFVSNEELRTAGWSPRWEPLDEREAARVFGVTKRLELPPAASALCYPKHVDAPRWRPAGSEQPWKCGTCHPPVSSLHVEWED